MESHIESGSEEEEYSSALSEQPNIVYNPADIGSIIGLPLQSSIDLEIKRDKEERDDWSDRSSDSYNYLNDVPVQTAIANNSDDSLDMMDMPNLYNSQIEVVRSAFEFDNSVQPSNELHNENIKEENVNLNNTIKTDITEILENNEEYNKDELNISRYIEIDEVNEDLSNPIDMANNQMDGLSSATADSLNQPNLKLEPLDEQTINKNQHLRLPSESRGPPSPELESIMSDHNYSNQPDIEDNLSDNEQPSSNFQSTDNLPDLPLDKLLLKLVKPKLSALQNNGTAENKLLAHVITLLTSNTPPIDELLINIEKEVNSLKSNRTNAHPKSNEDILLTNEVGADNLTPNTELVHNNMDNSDKNDNIQMKENNSANVLDNENNVVLGNSIAVIESAVSEQVEPVSTIIVNNTANSIEKVVESVENVIVSHTTNSIDKGEESVVNVVASHTTNSIDKGESFMPTSSDQGLEQEDDLLSENHSEPGESNQQTEFSTSVSNLTEAYEEPPTNGVDILTNVETPTNIAVRPTSVVESPTHVEPSTNIVESAINDPTNQEVEQIGIGDNISVELAENITRLNSFGNNLRIQCLNLIHDLRSDVENTEQQKSNIYSKFVGNLESEFKEVCKEFKLVTGLIKPVVEKTAEEKAESARRLNQKSKEKLLANSSSDDETCDQDVNQPRSPVRSKRKRKTLRILSTESKECGADLNLRSSEENIVGTSRKRPRILDSGSESSDCKSLTSKQINSDAQSLIDKSRIVKSVDHNLNTDDNDNKHISDISDEFTENLICEPDSDSDFLKHEISKEKAEKQSNNGSLDSQMPELDLSKYILSEAASSCDTEEQIVHSGKLLDVDLNTSFECNENDICVRNEPCLESQTLTTAETVVQPVASRKNLSPNYDCDYENTQISDDDFHGFDNNIYIEPDIKSEHFGGDSFNGITDKDNAQIILPNENIILEEDPSNFEPEYYLSDGDLLKQQIGDFQQEKSPESDDDADVIEPDLGGQTTENVLKIKIEENTLSTVTTEQENEENVQDQLMETIEPENEEQLFEQIATEDLEQTVTAIANDVQREDEFVADNDFEATEDVNDDCYEDVVHLEEEIPEVESMEIIKMETDEITGAVQNESELVLNEQEDEPSNDKLEYLTDAPTLNGNIVTEITNKEQSKEREISISEIASIKLHEGTADDTLSKKKHDEILKSKEDLSSEAEIDKDKNVGMLEEDIIEDNAITLLDLNKEDTGITEIAQDDAEKIGKDDDEKDDEEKDDVESNDDDANEGDNELEDDAEVNSIDADDKEIDR